MEVDGSDCPQGRNLLGSPCLRLLDRRLDATSRSGRSSRKAWRSMDASQSPIWFIGDLGDPWIAEIAESIASVRSIRRLDCPGSLPTYPFETTRPPRLIILHRHHLGHEDVVRLMDWRLPQGASDPPAVFLCVSPYVRYVELERVSRLVELVVSEGTAAEVLPRHVVRLLDGSDRGSPPAAAMGVRIEVACGNDELSRALVEACGVAGYRAEPVDDQEIGGILRGRHRPTTMERVLTIWEVPVLEPGWAERLEWRALRTGPIIALAGFADRAIVAQARAAGAIACLELPCDLEDVFYAIERAVQSTDPKSWPVPSRVEPPHALPPRSHQQTRRRGNPAVASPWSDRGPLPKIPT